MLLNASRTLPIFRACIRNTSKTSPVVGKSFVQRKYFGEPEPKTEPGFWHDAGFNKEVISYWFLYFTRDLGWHFFRLPGYLTLGSIIAFLAPFVFMDIYTRRIRYNPELLKVAS